MEIIVVALTLAVILRDPAGTIRAATAHKRAQIQKAQLKGNTKRPGKRALRNYLGTVWEAKWEEAARRYPEKMRGAQDRRERRKDAAKDAATKTFGRAKDAVTSRWEDSRRLLADDEPYGVPGPAPQGVVDLEEARRRREQAPAADKPEDKTKKEDDVPLNLSDATSLRAHLEALRGYGTYWDQGSNAKERLAANMRANGVGEATVSSVDSSRDASTSAAAAARTAAEALEQANMGVAEARAGSPDAGHGTYYERR